MTTAALAVGRIASAIATRPMTRSFLVRRDPKDLRSNRVRHGSIEPVTDAVFDTEQTQINRLCNLNQTEPVAARHPINPSGSSMNTLPAVAIATQPYFVTTSCWPKVAP
ncbi:MAG: hypothetical protein H7147_08985 [Frankiaceae bacterium]|nr:hypothetical protein [Arenimonas sp.]